MKAERDLTAKRAALMQLHADTYVNSGEPLVGAPISDTDSTYVFSTSTTVNLTAADGALGFASFLAVSVRPCARAHIGWGVTYDTGGSVLTDSFSDAYGSGSWAAMYDDYRCVAINLTVHSRSVADARNGDVCLLNINPLDGDLLRLPQNLRDEPSVVAAHTPSDEWKMCWIPARDESDYAWQVPTATLNLEATSVVFSYEGLPAASASLATFRIVVTAVWEARVLPTIEFLNVNQTILDPQSFQDYRGVMLKNLPLYSLPRHVGPDGFWGDVWDFAKKASPAIFGGLDGVAKSLGKVFSRDGGSVVNRLENAIDAAQQGIKLATAIGSMTTNEHVIRVLLSMDEKERGIALDVLNLEPTGEQLAMMLEQLHRERHRPTPPMRIRPSTRELERVLEYTERAKPSSKHASTPGAQ